MNNYNKNIDELIDKTIVRDGGPDCEYSAFKYDGLLVEEQFNNHYQFFQKYLDEKFTRYNINPTKLFYNYCTSINGWAYKDNGIGIVSINRGSIIQLKELFKKDEEFFSLQEETKIINRIQSLCDRPVWDLMHQTTLLYLFYHEVGHIIQDSDQLRSEIIEESTTGEEDYKKESHIDEIDADTFAAIRMGRHVLKYWRKFNPEDKNEINLIAILSIIVGGYGIYRLKLFLYSGEFYYRKAKHPHIVIRIAAFIVNVIEYVNNELSHTKELGDDSIKVEDAYKHALPILKVISDEVLGANVMESYYEIFSKEAKGIKDYYSELLTGMKNNPKSAYCKHENLAKEDKAAYNK